MDGQARGSQIPLEGKGRNVTHTPHDQRKLPAVECSFKAERIAEDYLFPFASPPLFDAT